MMSRSRIAAPVLIALIWLGACARKPPRVTVDPDAPFVARLESADALVRAGCFDCLVAAYREFDAVRAEPRLQAAATLGAFKVAALLAIRERELGFADPVFAERARELSTLVASGLALPASELLGIVDSLPGRNAAERRMFEEGSSWTVPGSARPSPDVVASLSTAADEDALSAYAWLSVNCTYGTGTREARKAAGLERLIVWQATPLIAFKAATCGDIDAAALGRLVEADARLVEAHYFLGLASLNLTRRDEGIERLLEADSWHERWPLVTRLIGTAFLELEEYEQAVTFFDRTLAIRPDAPDALLGKGRALANVGRFEDSIVPLDRILTGQWYAGDAYYWRAFDKLQLGRYDAAWEDIERAARSLVNAGVPKLAGIIAYKQGRFDVARDKLQEARSRDRTDCTTGLYLGLAQSGLRAWALASEVLKDAGGCLDALGPLLLAEVAREQASDDPPERKARRIARLERQVEEARRMLVNAWFNTAVASFNLALKDEARAFAERVRDDAELGERARELIDRLR